MHINTPCVRLDKLIKPSCVFIIYKCFGKYKFIIFLNVISSHFDWQIEGDRRYQFEVVKSFIASGNSA